MFGLHETIDQLTMPNSVRRNGDVLRRVDGYIMRKASQFENESQRENEGEKEVGNRLRNKGEKEVGNRLRNKGEKEVGNRLRNKGEKEVGNRLRNKAGNLNEGAKMLFVDQSGLLTLNRLPLGQRESIHPHLLGYYWIENIGVSVSH